MIQSLLLYFIAMRKILVEYNLVYTSTYRNNCIGYMLIIRPAKPRNIVFDSNLNTSWYTNSLLAHLSYKRKQTQHYV